MQMSLILAVGVELLHVSEKSGDRMNECRGKNHFRAAFIHLMKDTEQTLFSSGGRFKKEIVVDGQSYLLLIRDEGGPPELQVSPPHGSQLPAPCVGEIQALFQSKR